MKQLRPTGGSIPHLTKSIDSISADYSFPQIFATNLMKTEISFSLRKKRIHPQKDDKVLTDWNGLMIATMARAGTVLGDELISPPVAQLTSSSVP